MPLLRNQPFQRLHVSSDFKDDDEVFHCEITNEIFKDYTEFCDRVILCNSLVWSCCITGRTNMIYEEALNCERNAKKSLKEFPVQLRMPIVYLASKTYRSSFNDVTEDIYQFVRDRYFIGEMVEASFTEDSWCECHVLQVIAPTEQQLKAYAKETVKNPQEHHYFPPSKLFRYEVEQLDCGDSDISQTMVLEASQVRRRKQHYSKEKNKIFLRQLCEQGKNGIWVVKENVIQKYGIPKVRFDSIFAGPLPDFTSRPKKFMKQKQECIDKFLTSDTSKHRAFDKPDSTQKGNETGVVVKKFRKPRNNGKLNQDKKALALEEKAKRKEERALKRERKKEEKQKSAALAAYMRAWNKPREDLECENLAPIPSPIPTTGNIPNDKFGDAVMILEFLLFFNEELEVNSYFPNGLNLDLLERALIVKEASGPWSDLLQLLLSNIFKYQADEEDEIHADAANLVNDINLMHEGASSMAEAVKLATIASTWCQNHQSCNLSDLTLDHLTLSEILRLHLLSSGGRIGEVASKWRYSQRGGYTNQDDPVLLLRINKTHILRLLNHRNVCEFSLDDKLILATCLMNQLLTFASIRDVIEERYEKLHQAKRELKSFVLAGQKKEKEEKEKLKEREKEGKIEEEEEARPKKQTRGNTEVEKKKEEYDTKLKELQLAAKDNTMMLYLGSDRAHRRYWRFLSIPGIFVEDDERWPGNCLPEATPYRPELQDTEAAYTYLKEKFEDEVSDKENNFKKGKKTPKNGVKTPRKDMGGSKRETKFDITEARRSLLSCTSDENCPVHRKRTGSKWNFFGRQEEIESLIKGLNPRGIREGELRSNLTNEINSLSSVISNCPRHKLNSEVFSEPIKEQSTKSSKKNKYETVNINEGSDMDIDEVMELTIKDYILDFEDKITVGGLGSLKDLDRNIWRNNVTHKSQIKREDDKSLINVDLEVLPNVALDKVKNESKHSRPGTPDSEAGSLNLKLYQDPGKYLGPPSENELLPNSKQQASIKHLAGAILQLSHAIEPKYMKKPLGGDEKDKKWSSDEAREKWEQSLLASTSWSQLFLHLSTLENSVAWGKSAYNAQCRICKKKKDGDKMLLCDGCNKGHHMYCLKPKLTFVPEGDWFCASCKPRETKPKEKVRKRTRFEDESDEEVLTKETRHSRSKRIIESDEDSEIEDDSESSKSDEYSNNKLANLCASCKTSGKLISCDTCSSYYHLTCVDPPLSKAPRGRWSCTGCKIRKNNVKFGVRGREKEKEMERPCAAAARSRIHGFAKSLLTTESSDSSNSEETEIRQTRRARKRAAEEESNDKSTMKGCASILQTLLSDIRHHRDSWPFLSPVTKEEVPDYHDIISNPMDFGTIKEKLSNGKYNTLQEFYDDCQLIFDNCHTYNQENSSVYKAGTRLLKFIEKRCKELGICYGVVQPPSSKRMKLNGDNESEDEEMDTR